MASQSQLEELHAGVFAERVKYWRRGHRRACRKAEQKMVDYLTCAEIPTAGGWMTIWGVPVWRCAKCGVRYPALKPLTGYGWPLRFVGARRTRELNPTAGEAGRPPPGKENDGCGSPIPRDDDGEPVCRAEDSGKSRESTFRCDQ